MIPGKLNLENHWIVLSSDFIFLNYPY